MERKWEEKYKYINKKENMHMYIKRIFKTEEGKRNWKHKRKWKLFKVFLPAASFDPSAPTKKASHGSVSILYNIISAVRTRSDNCSLVSAIFLSFFCIVNNNLSIKLCEDNGQ